MVPLGYIPQNTPLKHGEYSTVPGYGPKKARSTQGDRNSEPNLFPCPLESTLETVFGPRSDDNYFFRAVRTGGNAEQALPVAPRRTLYGIQAGKRGEGMESLNFFGIREKLAGGVSLPLRNGFFWE